MTLGYVLSLCCNLNEIRVFWHFTSFPNRVLACPSQDASDNSRILPRSVARANFRALELKCVKCGARMGNLDSRNPRSDRLNGTIGPLNMPLTWPLNRNSQ